MPLYSYKKKRIHPYKRFISFFSYSTIILGAVFLFYALYPIFSYQIYAQFFLNTKLRDPIASSGSVASLKKAESIMKNDTVFSTNLVDYTKAAAWFPSFIAEDEMQKRDFKVHSYLLSIPKLNIEDAKVIVGGDDLTEGLIHYQPHILPCEFGKVSIFGHSTHPALARFSGPKRYASIFTYLPTLSEGDKILITINDVQCEYEVFEKFEITPDQIEVLQQQYDRPYLSLITCTPPGTYLRRLVVNAKLVTLPVENK